MVVMGRWAPLIRLRKVLQDIVFVQIGVGRVEWEETFACIRGSLMGPKLHVPLICGTLQNWNENNNAMYTDISTTL